MSNNGGQQKSAGNLSFCGCGFLGMYHVGVASCFHEYAPQLSLHQIAGASAGAIVATAYICGNLQLALATTDLLKVAIDARARGLGLPVGSFHPEFDINQLLLDALETGLPDDVHIRTSGKLHISLTRFSDFKNVVIKEFKSKADLIQVLMCSCFIPFWSGSIPPKYQGVAYVDGGLSNNLLILDDGTITVSPFSGEADICPEDQMMNLVQIRLSNTSFLVTPTNLFKIFQVFLPPSPQKLSKLFQQGFDDAMRYLQDAKLISCHKCLAVKPILKVETSQIDTDSSIGDKYDNGNAQVCSDTYVVGCSGGDDDSNCNVVEDCGECVTRRETALKEPLPKQFSDRIRDACEQVNTCLHNWIHSHKFGYLGYIPIVYYLPIDISLALFFRYWRKVPRFSEIGSSVKSIMSLIENIRQNKSSAFSLESFLETLLLYTELAGQQKI